MAASTWSSRRAAMARSGGKRIRSWPLRFRRRNLEGKPEAQVMAHTFDIRFARTAGFAALLEAPTNSFRWTGSGRLSIDAHGISIAVRRGLLALFPRTRRVAAADLKGVLREGHALRVEFSDGLERMVVPFWVRDPRTAEEIVRLLPTTRTVELDHEAAGVGNAKFRPDWRVLMIVIVLISS